MSESNNPFDHPRRVEPFTRTIPALPMMTSSLGHVLDEPCGVWLYGATGRGKSHYVWSNYPDAYSIPPGSKWNGYAGQDVVFLDNCSVPSLRRRYLKLKQWAGRLPFKAYGKNMRVTWIRPRLFFVASVESIDVVFKDKVKRRVMHKYFRELNFNVIERDINVCIDKLLEANASQAELVQRHLPSTNL